VNADFATIGYSNGGVPLWTNRYNGSGNGSDFARAVATDLNGNVFVTGYSIGTGSGYDFATLKYSSTGTPLWTNRFNGSGNADDYSIAMVLDGNGNVFVSGYSYNGVSYDYVTIKYSNLGFPLWTNSYNGPGNGDDYVNALAVDSGGNVIVTGYSDNGTSFDFATIKYSSSGIPLWTNRYNGSANDYDAATAIAVDASNNVFVTGYSYSASGSPDYLTVGYSSTGVPLWTNRYNGIGNGYEEARAVAVDPSGNVIVTGFSDNGTSFDYATICYSGAGMPLWTNRYNGSANGDDLPLTPESLLICPDSTVVVVGQSDGNFSSGTTLDYATVKYIPCPYILSQPQSRTNAIGSMANFSVTAGGCGPFGYQWRKNGVNLAGQTNATLILTNVVPSSGGDYSVFVSNAAGGTVSSVAHLAIFQFTSITRMPDRSVRLSLCGLTNTVSFRIEATTNLAKGSNWTTLTNLSNYSGTFTFTDLRATNFSRRFYRAVWTK